MMGKNKEVSMQFVKNTTWEEVFSGWREREAHNPDWIHCATQIKGWPDWESWRRFTAEQIHASERNWQIFKFALPGDEIPKMLIGPYAGWQSRCILKNATTFSVLLDTPERSQEFSRHSKVMFIIEGLPFSTQFIGLLRDDNEQIICVDGHHRATAIALAARQGRVIDWSGVELTIALARLGQEEMFLLDEALKRGTSKNFA